MLRMNRLRSEMIKQDDSTVRPMFRKILIANDGSEAAYKAVHVGIELARQFNADLHQISVAEQASWYVLAPLPDSIARAGHVLETMSDITDFLRQVGADAEQLARAADKRLTTHIRRGNAVEAILSLVKEHAFDLLLIGFNGHSRAFGGHQGTTSQELVRRSPCFIFLTK